MDPTFAPAPLRSFVDPDDPAYGRVVFYTCADVAYDHDTVTSELRALGLDSYAPRRPADVDVFRRVSTGAAVSRVPVGDHYANVLVRDVTNEAADDAVLRKVVVELVDAGNEQLDYIEAYDLRFFKDGGRLQHIPLFDLPSPADDVVSNIRQTYLAKRGTINGDAVRGLLKRAIRENHGIGIRPSGGVFFVPEAHADVVDRLHAWSRQHSEHIALFSFPLVKQRDGSGQDLLAGAFTSEAVDEAEKLLGELMAGGVSERRLTAITGEYTALSKRLSTYQGILEDRLDGVSTKVDMISMALGAAHVGGTVNAVAA